MIQKTANDKDPLQNVSRHTQNDKKILESNYLNNTQTFGVCNFGLCLFFFFFYKTLLQSAKTKLVLDMSKFRVSVHFRS